MQAQLPDTRHKVLVRMSLLTLLGIVLVAVLACTSEASAAQISAGDTAPPALAMLAPSNGSSVHGNLLIEVQASDNTALESIQYRITSDSAPSFIPLEQDLDSGAYKGVFDTTSIPDGHYTLEAQAKDTWGNLSTISAAILIDNPPSAPTGLAYTEPSSPSNGSYADLSWIANPENDLSHYNVYRSDSPNITSANKVDTAPGTAFRDEGIKNSISYYYAVSAVDGSGNESPLSEAILVTPADTLPPTISRVATANLGRSSAEILLSTDEPVTAEVEYGSSDNLASKATARSDAGTSFTIPLSALNSNTNYAYRVRAVDVAGNETLSDVLKFATLSDQSPTLNIQNPTSDAYIKGSILVSINAKDDWAMDSVLYAVNDGVFQTMAQDPTGLYTTTLDTTQLEDGVYTITGRARDDAGQVVEKTVTVNLDNSAPQTSDVNLQKKEPRSVSISWTTSEPATASIEFGKSDKLGLLASSGKPAEQSHDAMLEGLEPEVTYHYRIRAVDRAGNESVSHINTFITPADAKPGVTILYPQTKANLKGDFTLQISVLDDWGVSSVQYAIDSRPLQELPKGSGDNLYAVAINTAQIGDGLHTIRVMATDNGKQSTEAEVLATFDNTKPKITTPTVINTGRFRADVQWKTTEASTGVVEYGATSALGSIKASGATFSESHLVTLSNLAPGRTFYYRVRSTDAAGNETVSDIATFSALPDGPPSVSIVDPIPNRIIYGITQLKVQANDDWGLRVVGYSVDGGAGFTAMNRNPSTGLYEVTFDANLLGAGNRILVVRAEDDLGQKALAQISVVVNTPPSISILNLTEGARVSGALRLIAKASDNGSLAAVEYSVDHLSFNLMVLSQDTGNYTASINTATLGGGVHLFTVRATDNQGLTSESQLTLKVDNPPGMVIVSPSSGATLTHSITLQASVGDDLGLLAVEFAVDDGQFQPMSLDSASGTYQASLDTRVFAKGNHTISIRATDTSLQTTTSSSSVIFD